MQPRIIMALFISAVLFMTGCVALRQDTVQAVPSATNSQNSAATTQASPATSTADINNLKLGTVVPIEYCHGRCVANQQCVVDVECPPCAVGEDGKYLGDCTCVRGYTCQQQ